MNNNHMYGVERNDNYLAHYGVLGMKWGMRRAMKKGTNYQYRSHATKKYQKLAAKLAAKGKTEKAAVMANRAKRSAEVDRGEQEYAKGISTKKAVGLTLLAGGGATKGYAQYRAMSGQKGKDLNGQKVMAGIKALRAGSAGSRLAKAAYIRQDEKKETLGKTLAKINKKVSDVGANAFDTIAKTKSAKPGTYSSAKSGSNSYKAAPNKSAPNKSASKNGGSNLNKYSKDVKKGTTAAGLIGGGAGAGIKTAANLHKMKKNNPKQYAKFKKDFKNSSMRDRMKFAYGR